MDKNKLKVLIYLLYSWLFVVIYINFYLSDKYIEVVDLWLFGELINYDYIRKMKCVL